MTKSTAPSEPVIIYTDGACLGNPGPGGYGVVVFAGGIRVERSAGFQLTTNNRMELLAAIVALEMLKEPSRVTLHSDSRYLVDAMNQGWAQRWRKQNWIRKGNNPVANADLWERLLALCDRHAVEFVWVRGHAGDPENERCDQLAMQALSAINLSTDQVFEETASQGKPSKIKVTSEGQPCPKCGTSVVKRIPKRKRKPDQTYYYAYTFYCPNCQTVYLPEEAKRPLGQQSRLL